MMMASIDNPCDGCVTNQSCCRKLMKLKLTRAEFERHFSGQAENIDVQLKAPIYEIGMKEGLPCPHWDYGCDVYRTRPIECCLFPYTIDEIVSFLGRVIITVHSRVTCPKKGELLLPRKEVKEIVESFAREAFGDGYRIVVVIENFAWRVAIKLAVLLRVRKAVSLLSR